MPVSVGYSDYGGDELHVHEAMYEIHLVARGTSVAVVNGVSHRPSAGQMLAAEPGETHTLRESSADYLGFVVQAPFVPGDKTLTSDDSASHVAPAASPAPRPD